MLKRAVLAGAGTGASALLLAAAMPPSGAGWLAWLALAPVLIVVRGRGFVFGFALGMMVALMAGHLTAQGWIQPNVIEGNTRWNYLAFGLFGLVVGFLCAIVGDKKELRLSDVPRFAAWAVLLEAGTHLILPAHLGLTQYRSPLLLGLASVLGLWAVSYAVWFVNIAIVCLIRDRAWGAVATAGTAMLASCAPLWPPAPVGPKLRVGAIQTTTQSLDELAALNFVAGSRGADLVVWPELSGMASAPAGRTAKLTQLASIKEQPAFITTFEDDASPRPHNAAALFSKSGESSRFFKRKPFGGEKQIHAAGTDSLAVDWHYTKVGLNVCFDSCYPGIMRDTAGASGIGLLVVPSLDPASPNGTMQALHGAYSCFRAAELGVPIVRADTTGFSSIVDGRGRS